MKGLICSMLEQKNDLRSMNRQITNMLSHQTFNILQSIHRHITNSVVKQRKTRLIYCANVFQLGMV